MVMGLRALRVALAGLALLASTACSSGTDSRQVVTPAAAAPPPAYFEQVCIACHAVGGRGGSIGPALDGVGARLTPIELDWWLAHPEVVDPETTMPKLEIPAETRAELVDWLSRLR